MSFLLIFKVFDDIYMFLNKYSLVFICIGTETKKKRPRDGLSLLIIYIF